MKLLFTIDKDAYDRLSEFDDDLFLWEIPSEAKVDDIRSCKAQLQRPDGLNHEVEIVFYSSLPSLLSDFRKGCLFKEASKSDVEIGTAVWMLD